MAVPVFRRVFKSCSGALKHAPECEKHLCYIFRQNTCFLDSIRSSHIGNVTGKVGSKRKILGAIAVCVGVGMTFGDRYGLTEMFASPSRLNRFIDETNDTPDGILKTTSSFLKDVKLSRKMEGPTDFLGLELVLFQNQCCPLCSKVRAFLEFYGIPYSIVEINPFSTAQLKFSKYKKVPILMAKDSSGVYYELNDSSAIISILATYLLNPKQSLSTDVLPKYQRITYVDESTNKEVSQVMNRYIIMYDNKIGRCKETQIKEEQKWRIWVDSNLVNVVMPNIYRTLKESDKAFKMSSVKGHWEECFSFPERQLLILLGAVTMYFQFKKSKSKYNLKEDVRESMYDAANQWVNALNGRRFMGGEQPNLADLAVYGVLNSFEGCKAFRDMERETGIGQWYAAVKAKIQLQAASSKVPNPNKTRSI